MFKQTNWRGPRAHSTLPLRTWAAALSAAAFCVPGYASSNTPGGAEALFAPNSVIAEASANSSLQGRSRVGLRKAAVAPRVPTAASGNTLLIHQPYDFRFTTLKAPANEMKRTFNVTFTGPAVENKVITMTVPGFYIGNNTWAVRFAPTAVGNWTYKSTSLDLANFSDLNNLTGSFSSIANNESYARGLLQVDSNFPTTFVWQNGERHFKSGYEINWLAQLAQDGDITRVQTLLGDIVAKYKFTDVLFSVYTDIAKNFKGGTGPVSSTGTYGTRYDFSPTAQMPWQPKTVGDTSHAAPNFAKLNGEYWQNLDAVFDEMYKKGLVSHLYLRAQPNKYENDGNGSMVGRNSADEANYIDYVVARYQAFPNVVFDYEKEARSVSDTDHIAALNKITAADAYSQRLRTAHDADQITKANMTKFQYRTDQFHRGCTTTANPGIGSSATDQSYCGMEQYDQVVYQASMRGSDKPLWPVFLAESGGYQKANITGEHNYNAVDGGASAQNMIDNYAIEHIMAGGYYGYYYDLHAWDLVKYDEVPFGLERFANISTFMLQNDSYKMSPNKAGVLNNGGVGLRLLSNSSKTAHIALVGRGKSSITLVGLPAGTTFNTKWFKLVRGDGQLGGETFNATSTVSSSGQLVLTKPSVLASGTDSSGPLLVHLSLPTTGANTGPVITLAATASATPGQLTYSLAPTVTDDGLPTNSTLTYSWSAPVGSNVTFSTPNARTTNVTVPTIGSYALTLTVSDSQLVSSKTTTVTFTDGTTPIGGNGLVGEYFAAQTPGAPGTGVRITGQGPIAFNWGAGGPAALSPRTDQFSIRWTGTLTIPASGTYSFQIRSNDGHRLVIGSAASPLVQLVNWSGGIWNATSAPTTLSAGTYPISLEYYEATNNAEVTLSWTRPGAASTPIAKEFLSSAP